MKKLSKKLCSAALSVVLATGLVSPAALAYAAEAGSTTTTAEMLSDDGIGATDKTGASAVNGLDHTPLSDDQTLSIEQGETDAIADGVDVQLNETLQLLSDDDVVASDENTGDVLRPLSSGIVDSGTNGDGVNWELNSDGQLRIYGNGTIEYFSKWDLCRDDVLSVVVDGNIGVSRDEFTAWHMYHTDYWNSFFNFPNATSMDLKGLNTSNISVMVGMFARCSSITSLDLSCLDTSNVTDMAQMFYGCTSLQSLNLSGWDTSNVTDMSEMFYGCNSLKSLNGASFDARSVTSTANMFNGCSFASSFDFSFIKNLTTINAMFVGCSFAGGLDFGKLDTSNVTDMSYAFKESTFNKGLNLNLLDTSEATNMTSMFEECTFYGSPDFSEWDTTDVENMHNMFAGCESLTSLNLSSWVTSNVTDMGCMFLYCTNLASIDLSCFDTSNVVDMNCMFCCCEALKSLDLSNFATSKVTDMSGLLKGCYSIQYLDMSGFEVSDATNVERMFDFGYAFYDWMRHGSSLRCLKISSTLNAKSALSVPNTEYVPGATGRWINSSGTVLEYDNIPEYHADTYSAEISSVRSGSCGDGVFWNLDEEYNLRIYGDGKLDVMDTESESWWYPFRKSIKTVVVEEGVAANESCRCLFANLVNVTKMDVNSLDTSGVTDMYDMFRECVSLETLDLSLFDTSNVTDMCGMFYGCKSLRSIDVSSFVTSKVSDFTWMFYDCESLKVLDLSSFDTSGNSDQYYYYIDKCNHLSKVILSSKCDFNYLPKPSASYISGATGMWVNSAGQRYSYTEIPLNVADTYTAEISDCSDANLVASSASDSFYEAAVYAGDDISYANLSQLIGDGGVVSLVVEIASSFTPKAESAIDSLDAGSQRVVEMLEVRIQGSEGEIHVYDGDGTSMMVRIALTDAMKALDPYTLCVAYVSDEGTVEIMPTSVKDGYLYFTTTHLSTYVVTGEVQSDEPVNPDNPDNPDEPVNPDTPDTPDTPDNPDEPVNPDTPDTPDNPDTPDTPDTPDNPDDPAVEPSKTATQTMYRLYNPNSGEHFYTADKNERDSIRKVGWLYEGIAWTAPVKSNTPVYRLYSGTDHHYTTSAAERDSLVKAGWTDEGIGWYSDDAKGVPLYRQFNPNVDPSAPNNNSGSHNYTTSKGENDHLVSIGWREEGIGWYGCK